MRIRCAALIVVCAFSVFASAQNVIPDRNVNMVSGTTWPGGDPYLQRQNEPSIAVSTRNPLHLLAAANDYRTVDMPGLENIEETGDAWLGVFRSYDGGSTWTSTLLPGYPQDSSLAGMSSPLKGYAAGADPVVRASANGLFYYSGIVLNRGENPLGAVFVARYLDFNDKESSRLTAESAHAIRYLDTKALQKGTSGQFNDKPWIATDVPRTGSLPCTVSGQRVEGGNVYIAWTILVGGDQNVRSKMMVARSTDCGNTWQAPTKLSESNAINQGASIAIDPSTGAVYVVWRRITNGIESNALLFAKSTDFGQTFSKPVAIRDIYPFEQGTTPLSFRTTAFPSATVDNNGVVYIVWSERTANGDGRIAMITSAGGQNWSSPTYVVNHSGRGHQFVPSISYNNGKLTLAWYDQREDHTTGIYEPLLDNGHLTGLYTEHRIAQGHLALNLPEYVFNTYIQEIAPGPTPLLRRHTLDVYVAQALPGVSPPFPESARASQYSFGSRRNPASGNFVIEQMQYNAANLPLFKLGTVPFIGDYIDQAAQLLGGTSGSAPASVQQFEPVRHIVWTDNRDVRPPADGNWRNYTPVGSTGGPSIFDSTVQSPKCVANQTGMRNQNIYTTRVTNGLFAGSPGNTKPFRTPDGQPLQRAFVVFVQNTLREAKTYRLTILNQPAGGKASFLQLPEAGFPDPLTTLDVTIAARSSIARTVFATSSEKYDEIQVAVQEITAPDGTIVSGGLETVVPLNPDIANPDIANPDIANPDIANPDIANAEVYNPDIANPDIANPDIANPDIANPDIANPDIANPDIANPDIANPDIANPDIANPDIANPDIANPDIANPDIANGSVTDTTWETTNQGNTAASYSVNLLLNGQVPPAFKLQLILHRIYTTPAAGYTSPCALVPERHTVLFANINNPEFTAPGDLASSDVTDPSAKNATIWLLPGETMRITLRVVDPDRSDNITFNAAEQVTPVAVAHAINTTDLASGNPQPPISLTITTTRIPDPITGTAYSTQLAAIGGSGAKHWTATGLPSGLTISDAGVISGIATTAGNYTIAATATDSATPTPHTSTAYIVARVVDPLSIPAQTLATAATGQPYSATLTQNGGVAPFTWSLVSGSLPTGLTLSSGGVISGTPTVVQQTTFTVQVTDGTFPAAQTATRSLSLATSGPLFLIFLTQPASILEGATQNEIVIRAQDATGAVLPGISIFLAVGQTPCNASASVQNALTDATGVARFAAPPQLDACYGYTYRATATAPGYAATPVDSNVFDVFSFGNGGITIAATSDHTATLLPNGKVLIDGGTISPNNTLCQGELYDPSTRHTEVIPSSTVCRAGHTATLLPNGSVLIASGQAGSNANGDLGMQSSYELYDSATNTFSIAGNLPVPVAYNTATLLPNGSVLLAGGRGSTAAVKAIQIYDGTSWSSTMTLATARYNHTATLVGDYVVIAGGEDETGQKFSSVELINWKLGTVTSGGLLTEARARHGASLLGDSRILITGGYAGLSLTSSAEIYDPFTATSTPTGKMGVPRTNHIAQTLSDGTVLVAGGAQSIASLELDTSFSLTGSAEVFNPVTKAFSFVGGLSAPRWMMAGIPLQGADGRARLLAIRGQELVNGTLTAVPTVEVFYAPPIALAAVDDPLPHGTVDVDYYATLNSVGGTGSRMWTLVEGALPPGITLSPSGVLSGTPTASGVYPVTVRVTDSASTPAIVTLSTSVSIRQTQTLLTNLEYPTGLAIGNEKIYITETAGRNTTFGGAIRLRDYDTVTQATSILLDKPTNSDAVVALTSTQLYLGSYIGSIPGQSGAVSVATFNPDTGVWTESPVTSLAIAVSDMDLDPNGDIYVIGESDNVDAASLYRLPAGSYNTPEIVKRGLLRASSMTKTGTMTYYAQFLTNEVRRFNTDIDELFLSGVTVLSLTTDGTWIYYAQYSPGNYVKRRNIATGAEEILDSGPAQYNAVRYDAAQHKLYILEGGTAAAQFKDGKLKVLSGL